MDRVTALHYKVSHPDSVSYDPSASLEFTVDAVTFQLQDGALDCNLQNPVESIRAAQAVVDPILRAWTITNGLRGYRDELRFRIASATVERGATGEKGQTGVEILETIRLGVVAGFDVPLLRHAQLQDQRHTMLLQKCRCGSALAVLLLAR